MKKNFTPPVIVGVLCERTSEIPRSLIRMLKARGQRCELIPLIVKPTELKNLITCMKLMDIRVLFLFGRLRTHVALHLTRLDKEAQKSGVVDAIIRSHGGYRGVGVTSKKMGIFYQMCINASIERESRA